MGDYPIRVKMSAAALDDLRECEFGSYEDNIGVDGERTGGWEDGSLHIVEIIDRGAKTFAELRNQTEVDEFFGAALSGTFSLYRPRICSRIRDELSPYISDEMRASWICQRPMIGS